MYRFFAALAAVLFVALLAAAPPQKKVNTSVPEDLRGEAEGPVPPAGFMRYGDSSMHISYVVLAHTAALLFLMIVMGLPIALVMWKSGRNWEDSPRATQLYGVIFIVGTASLLLSVGFSGNQLAAITGILGTALGYLFGRQPDATPAQPAAPATTPPAK